MSVLFLLDFHQGKLIFSWAKLSNILAILESKHDDSWGIVQIKFDLKTYLRSADIAKVLKVQCVGFRGIYKEYNIHNNVFMVYNHLKLEIVVFLLP